MKESSELIQFSIYKINVEKVEETISLKEDENINDIKSKIIEYLRNCIKKGRDNVLISDYDEFTLMLIKSKRNPIWKNMVEYMINNGKIIEDIDNKKIINESTSYILFTIVDNKIYAMTGGRGANYISKFIEKNYGLYLIPKIVDKNNPIIRKVVENNITGNNLSTERITKNVTSVSMEDSLGSIYRELNIQVSKEIAKKLGVSGIEDNKQISISSGDSVVIRKSISLEELKVILKTLSKLEEKEDNFILNYFVPIRKKGIKLSYLKDIMIRSILNNELDKFQLVSDDISQYYFTSSKYILTKENESILVKTSPIEFKDIIDTLMDDKGRLYKTRIEEALYQYELGTMDENGETVIVPDKIINLLRGCIEDENFCYYLLNGTWYVFEEHFFNKLDEKYKLLYDNIQTESEKVVEKFNLTKEANNEDMYNGMFIEDRKIITVHKHEIKFIELADLIFYDDDNIYLMCNKGEFNGEHVRDLENQINTSSKMIELVLRNDKNLIKQYYNDLNEKEKEKIQQDDFLKLFNKQIVFIAGFSKNYKRQTRSPYAKYLLCELEKNLKNSGFNLLITNFTPAENKKKAQ
ncbi:MAG: TIGR04141 family sporadically distributed protein [Clostridium sp.]|nr:TIGR04141 family sporadically distributed protein [Clostridium sp.]